MKIGVLRERFEGEKRVATSPTAIQRLLKMGFEVAVETGAGEAANYADASLTAAGASVAARDEVLKADIILKVRPPDDGEVEALRSGQTLISFIWPAQNEALVKKLADKGVTCLAMDAIPRISRAQKMDALSSMSNISGYRGVIEAAQHFPRFFTGQITAAGKVPPAKVLVIGAGVAGLAALGAAKGLGAIVRSFDTRPAVKEQVESMGAEFLLLEFDEDGDGEGGYAKTMSKEFIDAEMALFREQAKEVDIIITTALIPGKKAPILVTEDMVDLMADGSVVVDLAAEQGGNCELTKPGESYKHKGVTIIGYTDLVSRMAAQSSALYANNLGHLLDDMGQAEGYKIDLEDDVVRGALITHDSKVMWPPPKPKVAPPKAAPKKAEPVQAVAATPAKKEEPKQSPAGSIAMIIAAAGLMILGAYAPSEFLSHFTVFVLAIFVGWQVVWNVTAALHTPLMSVTNAISGIIIIGGMLAQTSGVASVSMATWVGAAAILIAMINVAGGFVVTQRMLRMFRK